MLTRNSALADLAEQLCGMVPSPSPHDGIPAGIPAQRWAAVGQPFQEWAATPDLCGKLRDYLLALTSEGVADVIERSRETTTHFAWCLRDHPDEPFTFWLHEYKPHGDWRPGYADSVHNHRYHFCTTILRGGYRHERYLATLDPSGMRITSISPTRSVSCSAGDCGVVLADEFHRIPVALDGTMTFLVKSRPVTTWSLSFDPETGVSHRHIPVESRLGDLAKRITAELPQET